MGRYSGGTFILAGIGVFGYQLYLWVNNDHWPPMDLLGSVHWLMAKPFIQQHLPHLVEWVHSPGEWLALHQVLTFGLGLVPLWLFLLVSGGLLLALAYRGEKERSQTIASVESEMRARVGDKYSSK